MAPIWKAEDNLAINNAYTALQLDGLRSSHPINVEVGHPDRISEIFDEISYNKGMYYKENMKSVCNRIKNFHRGFYYSNDALLSIACYISRRDDRVSYK